MEKLFTGLRSKNALGEEAECYDCGSHVFVLREFIDRRMILCADCGRVYAEDDNELIDRLMEGSKEF